MNSESGASGFQIDYFSAHTGNQGFEINEVTFIDLTSRYESFYKSHI
jgi:hypothetical protein